MKIYVIGIGLIGGSMAMDLKALIDDVEVVGIDVNKKHADQAMELGIIDRIGSLNTIEEADRVILSIPVKESLELVPQLLDQLHSDALLWDVGSTKEQLCELISNHAKRDQFLAAHPIAGTEFSGPKAAHSGLFSGKPQILCESNRTRPDLLAWAKKTFREMGMYLRFMEAAEHDKHMAYVSHLSHISSFMLGKTVLEKEEDENNIFDLAGSGFESTVRLAKSSPAMWTPIFEQNKTNVIETLEEYIQNLQHFKDLMIQNDFSEIHNELKSTNYIKQILKGIQ